MVLLVSRFHNLNNVLLLCVSFFQFLVRRLLCALDAYVFARNVFLSITSEESFGLSSISVHSL